MRHAAVDRTGRDADAVRLDALVLQIGRLLREAAYRRERVVSPMLLRHLPYDAGYAWCGETLLRTRLAAAQLDATSLDHLIGNARAELMRLRGRADD